MIQMRDLSIFRSLPGLRCSVVNFLSTTVEPLSLLDAALRNRWMRNRVRGAGKRNPKGKIFDLSDRANKM